MTSFEEYCENLIGDTSSSEERLDMGKIFLLHVGDIHI